MPAEPSRNSRLRLWSAVGVRLGAAVSLLGACAPIVPALPRGVSVPAPELPPLPVEQITAVPRPAEPIPQPHDPLASFDPGRSVTLSAVDVDVRALLPALAEAADLSIVMGPEVQGRVTVNLIDVPALDAMRLVLQEAGLTIAGPAVAPAWAPVVFYQLPVHIDYADRELLRARYRISAEMAEWIVSNRLQ